MTPWRAFLAGVALTVGLVATACAPETPAAPVTVSSVSIVSAPTILQYGQPVQLSVVVKGSNGSSLTERVVAWSSSNDATATVSAAGLVTAGAVRGGTAESVTITATSEGKSATVALSIAPIPVTTVTPSLTQVALYVGQTAQMAATLSDATGGTVTGRPVVWSSATSSVATVSAQGLVTAVAPGTATITATVEGKQATAAVTVRPPVLSLTLSRDSVVLDTWGDTATVTAVVRNQSGITEGRATLRWESLDTAKVSVTSAGRFTSERVGTTRVRVTGSLAGAADVSAELPVRVALQRNPNCRVPAVPTRAAPRGIPAYGTNMIPLPGLTLATWPGVRPLPVDYDGDGDTDILRLEYMYPSSPGPYLPGVIRLYRNDRGAFSEVTTSVLSAPVGPDHARDFEIGDFTGDGVDDLYVAVHGFDAQPFPGAPNLFFTRSGTRVVESAASAFSPYQTRGFTHGSTSGDVDCDGDLDLVEIQANENEPSNLFLNDGRGRFTMAPASTFPPRSGRQIYQEGELLDIDNDGDLDLFLGCKSTTECTKDAVLVNDGFGRFRHAVGITLPPWGYLPKHAINQAKAADFDGDGWTDLLIYEIDQPFTNTSKIRLWINQRNGSFADRGVAWGLPAACTREIVEPLYVRDMNGDGWPDLVFANPGGGDINRCPELGNSSGILFNRGTGFSTYLTSTIAPWLQYGEITPADVDGDGKLDLLFNNGVGSSFWVRQP